MDLVGSYLEWRATTQEEIDLFREEDEKKPSVWPEKLLVIFDWGCNMYSCLDCSHPEYRILCNDNNISQDTYALEAPSFQQWLQALLDSTLEFDWDKTEKVLL